MSNLLLGLWIALIGADRIDLLGGHGPFVLTPFLALTPVVMIAEFGRRRMTSRPVMVSRTAIGYAAIAATLVFLVASSAFVADDMPVSASRVGLLVADIVGTFAVALLVSDRSDARRIFARGALLSLVIVAAFDVREILWFIGRGPESARLGSVLFRFDDLQVIGPLPRLAGAGGDGNRAGFVMVCFAAMIAVGEPRRWLRRVGLGLTGVFYLVAASRSASMAALAALGVALLTSRATIPRRAVFALALLMALGPAFYLARPRLVARAASAIASPLSERVSTSKGSAQGHVELIERGVNAATESVPRAMIGLGYGSSYRVLQDMFPGNRYGNFHSLYVTMFAESGIFALLLTLIIICTPLIVGGEWQPLVAGALAFNVFYQATAEPVFWFVMASAWLAMPLARRAEVSADDAGSVEASGGVPA